MKTLQQRLMEKKAALEQAMASANFLAGAVRQLEEMIAEESAPPDWVTGWTRAWKDIAKVAKPRNRAERRRLKAV